VCELEREREGGNFKQGRREGGWVSRWEMLPEKGRREKKRKEKKERFKNIIFYYYNIGSIFDQLRTVPKNYRK